MPVRALLVALLLFGWHGPARADLAADAAPRFAFLAEQLARIEDPSGLRRSDGWIYTIDVANYALAAAQAGDRARYQRFREWTVRRLVLMRRSDPYTDGFVLWRWREGAEADASGTAEAARLARALWTGAQRFSLPADGGMARRILRGYLRHQTVDGGIWFIRNYFNIQTRAFATNSYLFNHDPDILREVGLALNDAELVAASTQTELLFQHAMSNAALPRQIIQPEMETAFPGRSLALFWPDGIGLVGNACNALLGATVSAPSAVERFLRWTDRQGDRVTMAANGASGSPVGREEAGIGQYGCLVALATAARQPELASKLLRRFLLHIDYYRRTPAAVIDAHALGEAALGMIAARDLLSR